MRYSVLLTCLALGLGFASASAANKDKTTNATADDYSHLGIHSTLLGKLVLVNTNRTFLLQVEYEYYQPVGGRKGTSAETLIQSLSREHQKLLKEQEKILKMRNPIKRLQELQHFVAQQQQPGHAGHLPRVSSGQGPHLRLVKTHKNYDLRALDGVKVRTLQPPVALDAKGNPRKLTDAEKKAKKGPNPELPGYTSFWSHLKANLVVRVYFAPKKKPPATDAKPKAKDGDKEEAEEKPPVAMIVILEEEEPPAPVPAKKKN